jgi:hypothetical protein
MTTAQGLINSAAKTAGILAQGQTLEAGVNTDALKILNVMLARWQNSGIELGLSTLVAADTLYIDDADEEAIKMGLALRLMVEHKRPINPGLSQAGSDAMTELQAKYTKIPAMRLDSSLTHNRYSTYNIDAE